MGDLLQHIDGRQAGAWLRQAMITFGVDVGSFLPDHFEAYARIEHPEVDGRRDGCLPQDFVEPLIGHLRAATTTPGQCFFAEWEGYGVGQTIVRSEPGTSWLERMLARAPRTSPPAWKTKPPTLDLPERNYHVFAGPIEAAAATLSGSFYWQSANLWWPADHAWCVASEIDLTWTYVGGSRRCIDAILADARLGASERTARSVR